jgi:hypothetical protein
MFFKETNRPAENLTPSECTGKFLNHIVITSSIIFTFVRFKKFGLLYISVKARDGTGTRTGARTGTRTAAALIFCKHFCRSGSGCI